MRLSTRFALRAAMLASSDAPRASRVCMDYPSASTLLPPVYVTGPVVHGFGRGSKQLGIPTANLDAAALADQVHALPCGVYCGWASVGDKPEVYKMVMSLGWNPYYKNEKKTIEPYLMHTFAEDFYDQQLRLVVTGYLRPEMDFTSLDALIRAIHSDIDKAALWLDDAPQAAFAHDPALAPAAGLGCAGAGASTGASASA